MLCIHMKNIQFNTVPKWCPYSAEEIRSKFSFDLNSANGKVKYKCVHCDKSKSESINSIRFRIKRIEFTSLCTKCRGEIQRQSSKHFTVFSVPSWMNNWLNKNKSDTKLIEQTLNSGTLKDIVIGEIVNRGLQFKCVRCKQTMLSSISRIQNSISKHTFTGLCIQCLSSVRNNVDKQIPRISSNGYVLIQKSMVPKSHQPLFDWSMPVMEHRYKMAVKLNRPLTKDEIVHHIDGNKQNNSIDNLELWNNSHPSGQRVIDKLQWATDFITRYKMEKI